MLPSDQIEQIKNKIELRRVKMNSCLTVEEITRFEVDFKITLPEDYKQFLLEIGDGGGGPPFYGLSRLRDTLSPDSPLPFRPDLPFPLAAAWVWEGDGKDWWSDPSQIIQRLFSHGHLTLGTDGCGLYRSLIVSSPQYGQIWQLADVGAAPCDPPKTFLDWYEAWLDRPQK